MWHIRARGRELHDPDDPQKAAPPSSRPAGRGLSVSPILVFAGRDQSTPARSDRAPPDREPRSPRTASQEAPSLHRRTASPPREIDLRIGGNRAVAPKVTGWFAEPRTPTTRPSLNRNVQAAAIRAQNAGRVAPALGVAGDRKVRVDARLHDSPPAARAYDLAHFEPPSTNLHDQFGTASRLMAS